MLHQDMAWFDETRNAIGALTVRLSSDATKVQGVIITYNSLKYILYLE